MGLLIGMSRAGAVAVAHQLACSRRSPLSISSSRPESEPSSAPGPGDRSVGGRHGAARFGASAAVGR